MDQLALFIKLGLFGEDEDQLFGLEDGDGVSADS
jgi:hypothetical protein